jgi:hypothetical protein
MYARVSTFEGPVEDLEASVDFARTTLLPEARKLTGWRGCLNLVDAATGKELLVTLWDTEDHLRASEAQAGEIRDRGAEQSGRKPFGIERYRVVLGEVNSGS